MSLIPLHFSFALLYNDVKNEPLRFAMSRFLAAFLLFARLLISEEPAILLTSVIRDQAHLLPKFLNTIENYDYDKKRIAIHFFTYNNSDHSDALLNNWAGQHKSSYQDIIIETLHFPQISKTLNYQVKEYSPAENKILGELKNKGLSHAKQFDYYFYVEPGTFLAPFALKELLKKNKPIIAPLLKSIPECDDHHSNFFYKVTEEGYFEHHENYLKILFGWTHDTFQVPLVRDALLIKKEHLDKLTYLDQSNDYDIIIFGRSARKNGVDQFLTNESDFGVRVHFFKTLSREEENRRLRNILLMP